MSNNPAQTKEWADLCAHSADIQKMHLRDLFTNDAARFDRLSLNLPGLFVDYSRNNMTPETLKRLFALAGTQNVQGWRDKMFSGDIINTTEGRAVLHTALRAPKNTQVMTGGENVMPFIHDTLDRMEKFCAAVHDGVWTGYTGKKIKYIVNIGIGGSDLGPRMVVAALKPYAVPGLKTYFVSNVDGADIDDVLQTVNAEEALFIVASKTFTTQETMANANTAKTWLVKKLGSDSAVAKHFIALSTNAKAVTDFGIAPDNMFPFKDWVGGRYSLWSSIGLSIALSVGFKSFRALLDGAYAMDIHFRDTPMERNLPVILALIGVWNRNFMGRSSQAVIPYDKRLSRFPAYLQQMDMESNGKRVDRDGNDITDYDTGPVIFGEPGTDSQHSFFQKIHQGTDVIPVDFIAAVTPDHPYAPHHTLLLNNMVAQGQALMQGRTLGEAGNDPQRVFPGNRPSTTILLDRLDPYHLGMLIALYEHKVFVQGVVWNINSFDQFGVELGKDMAKNIESGQKSTPDSSTAGLLKMLRHP
jgi:glucose-6-phosphate isomerase